jgi:hypothetical protein
VCFVRAQLSAGMSCAINTPAQVDDDEIPFLPKSLDFFQWYRVSEATFEGDVQLRHTLAFLS